MTTFNKMIYFI